MKKDKSHSQAKSIFNDIASKGDKHPQAGVGGAIGLWRVAIEGLIRFA